MDMMLIGRCVWGQGTIHQLGALTSHTASPMKAKATAFHCFRGDLPWRGGGSGKKGGCVLVLGSSA
jgi:hypothetical protein